MCGPGQALAEPARFAQLLWRHRGERGAIPALLRAAERENGRVGREHLALVAQHVGLPDARLAWELARRLGLRTEPDGRHLVQTCRGEACHVRAAVELRRALAAALGVGPGQTTRDGLSTWEEVRCLGACDLAPALALDGHVHGPLDAAAVRGLVDRLRAGAVPEGVALAPHPANGARDVLVVGRVRRPGIAVAGPGDMLGEVVERAGGPSAGSAVKAALSGSRLLCGAAARLPGGAAGVAPARLVVLDADTCAVDFVAHVLAEAAARSCGRCALGHLGIRRLAGLAGGVRAGATVDLVDLSALAVDVACGARCDGCRAVAAVARDALEAFRAEFEAHAAGRCPAGRCGRAP